MQDLSNETVHSVPSLIHMTKLSGCQLMYDITRENHAHKLTSAHDANQALHQIEYVDSIST
jgi:hypothetical protein